MDEQKKPIRETVSDEHGKKSRAKINSRKSCIAIKAQSILIKELARLLCNFLYNSVKQW